MLSDMQGPAIKFTYDGSVREVDNITFEPSVLPKTAIGFEMRKDGKFSYRIKRYSYDRMRDLQIIDAPHRSGPVIARPL